MVPLFIISALRNLDDYQSICCMEGRNGISTVGGSFLGLVPHPKVPPFDRLSINWQGKSISTFVFEGNRR